MLLQHVLYLYLFAMMVTRSSVERKNNTCRLPMSVVIFGLKLIKF